MSEISYFSFEVVFDSSYGFMIVGETPFTISTSGQFVDMKLKINSFHFIQGNVKKNIPMSVSFDGSIKLEQLPETRVVVAHVSQVEESNFAWLQILRNLINFEIYFGDSDDNLCFSFAKREVCLVMRQFFYPLLFRGRICGQRSTSEKNKEIKIDCSFCCTLSVM